MIIAERYAEAFLGFAKETIGVQKAIQELIRLKTVINDSPELLKFLESQEITYAEKNEFINRVFENEFSAETRQFLSLLLRKERINRIIDIAEYIRVTYAHGGISEAVIKSAFPLDTEVIKGIKEKLEEKFNKKFKFYIDLDDSLLGGIQVIMKNTIIDGTVKRRLEDLKEKLKTVRII